jgi:PAS domain S-box-containing protein
MFFQSNTKSSIVEEVLLPLFTHRWKCLNMSSLRNYFARTTWLLPLVVLFLGLMLATIAAGWLQKNFNNKAEQQFERTAKRVSDEIIRRFEVPVYGLRGTRTLLLSRDKITRSDARSIISGRDLAKEFPGVRGFGFIQYVARADLAAFLAQENTDPRSPFAIRQLVDKDHADLYIIKIIEPAENNIGALGLDIGSEPHRRAAAQLAVDTGKVHMTSAISLVQNAKKTPGVLIFLPIYKPGAPINNVSERRAALIGLSYAPLVISEMVAGMFADESDFIDFELFDVENSIAQEHLLYDADGHMATLKPGQVSTDLRRFHLIKTVQLHGRTLTLQVNSTFAFEKNIDQRSAWIVFWCVVLLSLLVAMIIWRRAVNKPLLDSWLDQLKAAQSLQFDIAQQTAKGILIADMKSDVLWLNAGFTVITGYNLDQVIGQNIGALLRFSESEGETVGMDDVKLEQGAQIQHGQSPNQTVFLHQSRTSSRAQITRASLDLNQLFLGKVEARFECHNVKQNGVSYWAEIEVQGQYDAKGNRAGYLIEIIDITERINAQRQLQAALRDSTALLSTLNLYGIISIADRAGNIIEVNDSFCKISGYTREELLGKNHRIVNSGTQSPAFWLKMWQDVSGGIAWHGEVCNCNKEGDLYWVDTVISPFFGDDGQIEKYISIRNDITAQKVNELRLARSRDNLESLVQQKTADLQESVISTKRALSALYQQKYVLDQHAIVSICNVDGSINYGNERFVEISGYSPAEFLGKDHHLLNSGHHQHGFFKSMYEMIANGDVWRGEICNRNKHGELYWVDSTIAAFMGEDGKPKEYISVRTDITGRKLAEKRERFRSNVVQLLAGNESLASILNAIAVEIERVESNMLCSIFLVDSSGQRLKMQAAPSLPDFYKAAVDGVEVAMGAGTVGTAAFTGKRFVVDDVAKHPYWTNYREFAVRAGFKSCWAQPIKSSLGRVHGVIAIYHVKQHSPSYTEVTFIEQAANLIGIAIDRKQGEAALFESEKRFE